nr:DUF1566 domain-containing protein [uncultured Desulfobulbus sp.]
MRHILSSGQQSCFEQTGQEKNCTGTGQDGEFCRGIAWPKPRFRVEDTVVFDQLSGLYWTRSVNIGGFPCTWNEAFEQVAALNQEQYGGYGDWRLPNRNELHSLLSYADKKPALPAGHPFTDIFLGWYWTSTTAAINPAYAWAVQLEGARLFYGRKDQAYLFWPVRGEGNGHVPETGQQLCFDHQGQRIACANTGQDGELRLGTAWPQPRFALKDDLVTDHLTGLTWARTADITQGPVPWEQAFSAVRAWAEDHQKEKIDWYLPTINELASLVDCSRHSPALPKGHPFTSLQEGYWAATTSVFETDWSWVFYTAKGALGVGYKKDPTFWGWPVGVPRGGGE